MAARIGLARTTLIGGAASAQIAELCTGLGLARPVLVTDSFLVETGVAPKIMEQLQSAGLSALLYAEAIPDPTTASLEPGLDAVRSHGADSVIGLGGGSPIDTAKALALLAAQGGQMRQYKAPFHNLGPALPVIAVPTTAGSGSEATQFTIITDSDADEKMLCAGPAFLPIAAVIDYELTLSMPPRLTADTGIDALTHAIEAYVSKKANRFSDSLALVAIATIGRNLRRAYHDGGDAEAREHMMLAAHQAGIAFSNASVALVHGMSRPIGAHFGVAHGLSNAMLLPTVTAFSVGASVSRYGDCARALGVAHATDSDTTASDRLVVALQSLCHELEVPTPHTYGIAQDRWDHLIPAMAQQALASGSPANNPRVPTADEISNLYRYVYR